MLKYFVPLFLITVLWAAPQPKKQPLDINNATVVELKKLPGVSSLLARKIVANRPYLKVDDLVRAGVPKDTLEKIRPLVTADESLPTNHPRRRVMPPAKPRANPGKS